MQKEGTETNPYQKKKKKCIYIIVLHWCLAALLNESKLAVTNIRPLNTALHEYK